MSLTSNQLSPRTVYGWIEKEELLRKASCYSAGTIRTRSDGTTFRAKADLYETQNRDLHGARTLSALKADVTWVGQQESHHW